LRVSLNLSKKEGKKKQLSGENAEDRFYCFHSPNFREKWFKSDIVPITTNA
jgi:hypothetical protein